MKNDQVYIQHILEAIDRIQEYTEDVKEEEFREKEIVQDAVIRQIEVIGEATKQLSEQEKEKYPGLNHYNTEDPARKNSSYFYPLSFTIPRIFSMKS